MEMVAYKDREVRSYYDAADVMEIMGVGRSKAYTMIRIMREELVNSGELTACYPTLFTLAMYSILALVAFRERGYEAIGGELLAALLFGALVYYSLSYIEFSIMEELKKRHHRKPVNRRMEI